MRAPPWASADHEPIKQPLRREINCPDDCIHPRLEHASIGQLLWLKELMSYKEFPPLQAPETYNLDGILKQVQASAREQ